MTPSGFSRRSLLYFLVASPSVLVAQSDCLFNEGFNGPGLPPGWVASPDSVQVTGGGGAYNLDPWTVGDADVANANGYFPVPDQPLGNSFAMANDDADPCDCDLDGTILTSPLIDLSGTLNSALSYRVYHDGQPFNTQAWLETSTDGSAWSVLEEIPAINGAWQQRLLDLSAFDGGDLFLRFRFEDNGAWASGMAVDDVCVFARPTTDIAVLSFTAGNTLIAPFNTSERTLGYGQWPLEQVSPLMATIRIRQLGSAQANAVNAHLAILLDGVSQTEMDLAIATTMNALLDTTIVLNTGWTAPGAGLVQVDLEVSSSLTDERPVDNAGIFSYRVTSAGSGNNAMAIDNDLPESTISHAGGYSAGCRFELLGGASVVHGISTRFGGGTTPGANVKAVLTDANLNTLSGSGDYTITEADIALSFAGGTVYIPLDSAVAITTTQDVIAFVRAEADTGSVVIAAGGEVATGAALKVVTNGLYVSYPPRAPIVRIHLSDPVTGIDLVDPTDPGFVIYPNPATDQVTLLAKRTIGTGTVRFIDSLGRLVLSLPVRSVGAPTTVNLVDLPTGCYTVHLAVEGEQVGSGRLLLLRP